jgi:hypothetical protein
MKKISLILFCFILKTGVFSQGLNLGFESSTPGAYTASNSISGWTLSSQTATCGTSTPWTAGSSEFSIIATPIVSFPTIGNIGNSPLGGNNVARINNSTANSFRTKLVQTFSVNSSNSLFIYSYAGVWEYHANNSCCDQAGLIFLLKDQAGSILSCTTASISPGAGCQSSGITYSYSSASAWNDWQTKYIDLSPYLNTNITVEIMCTDCSNGDHFGTVFFDAQLSNQFAMFNTGGGVSIPTTYPPSSYCSWCPGSNIAQISAPIGYTTYQWYAPGSGSIAAPQGTMSTLTISNPISNSIYTVMMVAPSGCIYTATYAIVPSTLQIVALGSNSSCIGGSSGSASVVAFGSGAGYIYSWINSSNSVVATSSIVSNLASGIYSIQVTAAGSSSSTCGTANNTVTIGSAAPGLVSQLKPYCNNEAYLCAGTGTNYQWYFNSTAITSSLGGTIPCYTLTSPTNSTSLVVAFTSTNNCRDSVQYVLFSSTPGFVTVVSNPMICPGATNGTVTLAMVATPGAIPVSNWCSIVSTGSTSAYTASFNPASYVTFTATNLSAGGTYSVSAFDGACKYSTNFSVTPYVFNFTLSPSNSPTLCLGNSIAAGPTFTSPPSPTQYSYSWSPSTYVIGGMGSYQVTILTATSIPGSSLTIIYTVVVTPSLINCPQSKTLAVTFANPQTPTITAIPAICSNGSNFSIPVNPLGGSFVNGNSNAINSSGILSPSLAFIGVNTFTYANSIGTCVAKSSASYVVNDPPQISISGNTLICEGNSTSLLANGPASFTWNTIANGPIISVSPSITAQYTVSGFNASTQCYNSKTISVNVLPLPQISTSGDSVLCFGESVTLNASGANSYSWNTGSSAQNITVSPTISTNYSVIGTNTIGNCSNTKVISITVSECTGIYQSGLDFFYLKIYPNPNSGNFYIETENKVQINIFDDLGKLIFERQFEKGIHNIDFSDYNSGVYLLKFSDAHSLKVLKLLKTD